MVERLRTLSVEHLKVLSSPLPYGRAPKGDGGQSSLLPHSIDLFGGGAMVERLRTLSVEPPKGSLTVEPASASLWSST